MRSQQDGGEAAALFDTIFRVLGSTAYRKVVETSLRDDPLPDWLLPFSFLRRSELEMFAEVLDLRPQDQFVELGSGLGGTLVWLVERTGAFGTGLDISPEAVTRARSLAKERNVESRAHFVVGDMTRTGLPGGGYSGIVSVDAILFADPAEVVAEMQRILRPGGTVALTTLLRRRGAHVASTLERWEIDDYGPYFEKAGFHLRKNEEVAGWHRHAELLREAVSDCAAELGEIAELLTIEAEKMLEKPRVLVVATKA